MWDCSLILQPLRTDPHCYCDSLAWKKGKESSKQVAIGMPLLSATWKCALSPSREESKDAAILPTLDGSAFLQGSRMGFPSHTVSLLTKEAVRSSALMWQAASLLYACECTLLLSSLCLWFQGKKVTLSPVLYMNLPCPAKLRGCMASVFKDPISIITLNLPCITWKLWSASCNSPFFYC